MVKREIRVHGENMPVSVLISLGKQFLNEASEEVNEEDGEEQLSVGQEETAAAKAKLIFRQSNLQPVRPDAEFIMALDNSTERRELLFLKMNQMKAEWQNLIAELKSLNLRPHVEEAVNAILSEMAGAKQLTSSDLEAIVQVCSVLHIMYEEFSALLLKALRKVFLSGKAVDYVQKENIMDVLLELFYVGVVEDATFFKDLILNLTNPEDLDNLSNLRLIVHFIENGRIFFWYPDAIIDPAPLFFKMISDAVGNDLRGFFRDRIDGFYRLAKSSLCAKYCGFFELKRELAGMVDVGEDEQDQMQLDLMLQRKMEENYKNEFKDNMLRKVSFASYKKFREPFEQLRLILLSYAKLRHFGTIIFSSLELPPPPPPVNVSGTCYVEWNEPVTEFDVVDQVQRRFGPVIHAAALDDNETPAAALDGNETPAAALDDNEIPARPARPSRLAFDVNREGGEPGGRFTWVIEVEDGIYYGQDLDI